MKFFHLSDLHIGKHLYRYSLLEDQKYVLEQVIEAAKREKPEAVLLAGDIYDKPVPSGEAVHLLDWFLTELSNLEIPPAIIMIAGNHDSGERLSFANELLKKHRVHIGGMPPKEREDRLEKVTLEDEWGRVHFYLLPFTKPAYLRQAYGEEVDSYDKAIELLLEKETIDLKERNVLVSHQFYTAKGSQPETCDSEVRMVGGVDEVDSTKLEIFDYVALGHLHRAQKVGRESCRYGGTLLKYSVSEQEHEKGFTIVELGKKGEEPQICQASVQPLRDVKMLTGELSEVLERKDAAEDFVSITLTDEIEPYLPKERLEAVFSHILEIRIDNERTRKILELEEEEIPEESPMESFATFFETMQGRSMSQEENAVMQEVWNRLLENGGESL